MPDLLQRAFGALWRLFMTLWMFGDGYIVSAAQFDPVSTLVTPCSVFLYLYILFFPTSSIAARFVPVFDLLDGTHITVLVSVLAVVLFRLLFQRSSLGVLCVVALPILEFCRDQHIAYRARRPADTFQLPEPPQAGAAAAEAEGSEYTAAEAVHEASLAAEQEQPTEPEQSDGTDPAGGPPEVGAPESRALGVMKIIWFFLRLVVALGALTVVAHFLIDTHLKGWAVNTAPINGTPVFEAEVIIQANKTELPISVPLAEFIPTGTFGSPCQAAPTPTPIAKSTQAWIGTAMSTPMPTPMPAPTPTPSPPLEPVPAPIKPNDALNRLFDFDLPDPTPVLKWYFSLPTASQYTVIIISLMVLWCLSKPLIILAAHLVVLAIAYFFSAAVIALLLVYGFTTEQSVAIALPADFALIGSLWWIISWLKSLATASNSTIARVNEHEMRITDHANEINHLGKKVDTKADLVQTTCILECLYEKIADLETSKGDAPLLREVQRKVDSTRRLAENTRKEKADATELEDVRKKLERMIDLVDEMQKKKADHGALTELTKRLDGQVATVDGMLTTQGKLTEDVEALKTDMRAKAGIASVAEAHNRITCLEKKAEKSLEKFNNLNSQVPNDRERAKQRMTKIEQENVNIKQENEKLKQDVGRLENDMRDIGKTIEAIQASQVTQDDLQVLRKDVTSDADRKIKALRSDTDTQHEQVTRTHDDFAATVNSRFADSDKAVKQVKEEAESGLNHQGEQVSIEVNKVTGNIWNDFHEHTVNTDKNFVDSSMRIDGVDESISNLLQRVEAIESQQNGPIAQLVADESTHDMFDQYMDDFLQSKRDLMREEVHDVTHEVLGSDDFQDRIFASIMERQAHDNSILLLGDSPAVNSDARASPDGVEPPTSPAASDNMIGNDDPLGDSPGVINGGRATLPGDMSSDDTTSPIIPEESTIPDDVDDHHGTRGVPPGEPPGENLRGRSTSLVGSTSDGPCGEDGTGSRPSGESDDDTLQPKQWEAKEPREPEHLTDDLDEGRLLGDFLGRLLAREEWPEKKRSRRKTRKMYAMAKQRAEQQTEPGNLSDEQLHDSGNQEQPGGEQDAETDEEKTDDEADGDADDNPDDDDSDDDDPPGPPPGSGGFHGHDGTGGGGDDDEDGDNGGAPRPFTGPGASRSAPGLASSRYASGPLSGSDDLHGSNRTGRNDDEAHDRDGGGAPGPSPGLGNSRHATGSSSGTSNFHEQNHTTGGANHNKGTRSRRTKPFDEASETQQKRRAKRYEQLTGKEKKQENQKKQEQNEPTQLQNPPAQRQPQPIQRQSQTTHRQNGPTQGHGQPTSWQNGPTYGQNQASQRQNQLSQMRPQPLQSQRQPIQRHGQSIYGQNGPGQKQNQPMQRQNQQTGEGQKQHRRRHRRRGKGGGENDESMSRDAE